MAHYYVIEVTQKVVRHHRLPLAMPESVIEQIMAG